jgi:chemotaxis signal transduction protein
VLEAVPFSHVKRTPKGADGRIGMLDVDIEDGGRHFVWVFDLARLLGASAVSAAAAPARAGGQVLLVRHGATTVGLLVDDVHSVQRFDPATFTSLGLAANPHALSRSLIKANGGEVLIQELRAQQIVARVCGVVAEAV